MSIEAGIGGTDTGTRGAHPGRIIPAFRSTSRWPIFASTIDTAMDLGAKETIRPST